MFIFLVHSVHTYMDYLSIIMFLYSHVQSHDFFSNGHDQFAQEPGCFHQVGVVKTATFGTFWVTLIGVVDMDMPQCLVVQLVGVMVLQLTQPVAKL